MRTLKPASCLSVAALKQVLVTQLMSQEAAEQTKRSTGARLLRTTSLRTPVDSRARVMVHNGSEKSSTQTEDPAQDLGSGDTGFFDSPEDYGEPGLSTLHFRFLVGLHIKEMVHLSSR